MDRTETILEKLTNLFGERIAKAFEDEDIIEEGAMTELLAKDSDAAIFQKLGLSFGKVVKLKEQFKNICRQQYVKHVKSKPSMVDLGKCDAETRRIYLAKRKKVSMLAAQKWGDSCPRFNTAETKLQLEEFSKEIEDNCAVPEIGFQLQGIMDHIRDYFNEQRRHKKRSSQRSSLSPSSASSTCSSETSPVAKKKILLHSTNCNSSSLDDDETQDIMSDQESEDIMSTDTLQLFDDSQVQAEGSDDSLQSSGSILPSPKEAEVSAAKLDMTNQSSLAIIRAVTGHIINRDDIVKLLRSKFKVATKTLTPLTASELNELLARKLVGNKYVVIKGGANSKQLHKNDINVIKEIEM